MPPRMEVLDLLGRPSPLRTYDGTSQPCKGVASIPSGSDTDHSAVVIINLTSTTTSDVRTIELRPGKPVNIGRASKTDLKNMQPGHDNAYFDCPVISRNHASLKLGILQPPGSQVSITDHSSLHGTRVNGVRINPHKSFVLHDGDTLRLGGKVTNGTVTHEPITYRFQLVASSTIKPLEVVPRILKRGAFTVPSSHGSDSEEEEDDIPTASSARKQPNLPTASSIVIDLSEDFDDEDGTGKVVPETIEINGDDVVTIDVPTPRPELDTSSSSKCAEDRIIMSASEEQSEIRVDDDREDPSVPASDMDKDSVPEAVDAAVVNNIQSRSTPINARFNATVEDDEDEEAQRIIDVVTMQMQSDSAASSRSASPGYSSEDEDFYPKHLIDPWADESAFDDDIEEEYDEDDLAEDYDDDEDLNHERNMYCERTCNGYRPSIDDEIAEPPQADSFMIPTSNASNRQLNVLELARSTASAAVAAPIQDHIPAVIYPSNGSVDPVSLSSVCYYPSVINQIAPGPVTNTAASWTSLPGRESTYWSAPHHQTPFISPYSWSNMPTFGTGYSQMAQNTTDQLPHLSQSNCVSGRAAEPAWQGDEANSQEEIDSTANVRTDTADIVHKISIPDILDPVDSVDQATSSQPEDSVALPSPESLCEVTIGKKRAASCMDEETSSAEAEEPIKKAAKHVEHSSVPSNPQPALRSTALLSPKPKSSQTSKKRSVLRRAAVGAAKLTGAATVGIVGTIAFLSSPYAEQLIQWLE